MTSSPTVAVVSAGEMGAGVGRRLREAGLRVVTTLTGRSERTRERAGEAGLEDAGSLAAAVREADVLLSIVPPGRALELAEAAGRDPGPLYVDCNAVSPATARAIAAVIGDRSWTPASSAPRAPPASRRPGATRPSWPRFRWTCASWAARSARRRR
ncbi:MAG TPA: NAD(P)-binding domain-containing protein [Candidatus Eisenbacteria bacterium]|nr:NAD(P)-binding domain-containing protein [Candidatus Eisenbacteria bacterium]